VDEVRCQEYLALANRLREQADASSSPEVKAELNWLALSYQRLADAPSCGASWTASAHWKCRRFLPKKRQAAAGARSTVSPGGASDCFLAAPANYPVAPGPLWAGNDASDWPIKSLLTARSGDGRRIRSYGPI
jgi:hypothetical protein